MTLAGRVSPFRHLRIKGHLPPPRSFSQAITSFVAWYRQGIHHMHLVTWPYNCCDWHNVIKLASNIDTHIYMSMCVGLFAVISSYCPFQCFTINLNNESYSSILLFFLLSVAFWLRRNTSSRRFLRTTLFWCNLTRDYTIDISLLSITILTVKFASYGLYGLFVLPNSHINHNLRFLIFKETAVQLNFRFSANLS